MKKIINGRKYDTGTATFVGNCSYGLATDLDHWSQDLYRKRTGEFFLLEEGGPASQYSEYMGNNSYRGIEKLTPISYEDARKWAEKYLEAEEYERIFGEVDESKEKQTVTFRLTSAAVEKVKKLAAEQSRPMSEIIENLIKEAK